MRAALRPRGAPETVRAAVRAAPGGGEGDDRLSALTPRERQVFALLIQGKKQREIADLLAVRPTTVGFHTQSLYRKLGVHDRAQLLLRYALPGQSQFASTSNEEGME